MTEVLEWYYFYYEQFDNIAPGMGDCELFLKQIFKKDCNLCSLVELFHIHRPNYVDPNLFATFALMFASGMKTNLHV